MIGFLLFQFVFWNNKMWAMDILFQLTTKRKWWPRSKTKRFVSKKKKKKKKPWMFKKVLQPVDTILSFSCLFSMHQYNFEGLTNEAGCACGCDAQENIVEPTKLTLQPLFSKSQNYLNLKMILSLLLWSLLFIYVPQITLKALACIVWHEPLIKC